MLQPTIATAPRRTPDFTTSTSELLQGETGCKEWVEAHFIVETDIEKLGDKMIECIEAKRAALGI